MRGGGSRHLGRRVGEIQVTATNVSITAVVSPFADAVIERVICRRRRRPLRMILMRMMKRMTGRIPDAVLIEWWMMLLVLSVSLEINGADGGIDKNLDVTEGGSQLRIEVCVAQIIFAGKSNSGKKGKWMVLRQLMKMHNRV